MIYHFLFKIFLSPIDLQKELLFSLIDNHLGTANSDKSLGKDLCTKPGEMPSYFYYLFNVAQWLYWNLVIFIIKRNSYFLIFFRSLFCHDHIYGQVWSQGTPHDPEMWKYKTLKYRKKNLKISLQESHASCLLECLFSPWMPPLTQKKGCRRQPWCESVKNK